METSDLIHSLILWYIAVFAIELTPLSGMGGLVIHITSLALSLLLPLYVVGGAVLNVSWTEPISE